MGTKLVKIIEAVYPMPLDCEIAIPFLLISLAFFSVQYVTLDNHCSEATAGCASGCEGVAEGSSAPLVVVSNTALCGRHLVRTFVAAGRDSSSVGCVRNIMPIVKRNSEFLQVWYTSSTVFKHISRAGGRNMIKYLVESQSEELDGWHRGRSHTSRIERRGSHALGLWPN